MAVCENLRSIAGLKVTFFFKPEKNLPLVKKFNGLTKAHTTYVVVCLRTVKHLWLFSKKLRELQDFLWYRKGQCVDKSSCTYFVSISVHSSGVFLAVFEIFVRITGLLIAFITNLKKNLLFVKKSNGQQKLIYERSRYNHDIIRTTLRHI